MADVGSTASRCKNGFVRSHCEKKVHRLSPINVSLGYGSNYNSTDIDEVLLPVYVGAAGFTFIYRVGGTWAVHFIVGRSTVRTAICCMSIGVFH